MLSTVPANLLRCTAVRSTSPTATFAVKLPSIVALVLLSARVVPDAAEPATRPPLPATVIAVLSSVPFALTFNDPAVSAVRLVNVDCVCVLDFAVESLNPAATIPTARPVALAV